MKLFIINDFGSQNGGASKVAIDSACGLARRGHDVTFLCAVGPLDPSLEVAGVKAHCLGQSTALDNPNRLQGAIENLWNKSAANSASEILKSPLDIVHVHSWTKALSSSIFSPLRSHGVPTIITLHDYFSVCPNGALFSYKRGENCGYRPLSAGCMMHNCEKNGIRSMKNFRLLRHVIQAKAAGLDEGGWTGIAVSEFSRDLISPYLPKNVRTYVVRNPGISVQQPAASPENSDFFIGVGRLVPEKGMVLLAEAAKRAGVRVIFVGEGSELASIKTANPQAECLGWLDHEAAMASIRKARALVFPSLWPETQGLVVDEAASVGIPAIVSDNTAARDRVVNGVNGLHFTSGDIASLCACLVRLKDSNYVQKMGREAYRAYWNSPPGLDLHVDALEGIYRDRAARRSP